MVCNGDEFDNYDFDILDIINEMECDIFSADTIVPGVEPTADISNFLIDDVSPIVDTINTASEYIDFSSQCFYLTSSSDTSELCNFNEFFADGDLSQNFCEVIQKENTTNSNKCKISTTKQLFQNIPACSRTSDRPFILRGTGYERYCKNLSSQRLGVNKENVKDTVKGEITESVLVRDTSTTCYRNNQDNTTECRRKSKHKKIRKKPFPGKVATLQHQA
ncbi:uncharacterized protein LOC130662355 isoform X2 [Hydractinia symbiolongicarpus]|uniref:uncharacterized protein LOC130662355 isoform X2 n=1 Tax=Hydractinia symbiolongicarpus TaxID=13093 RepID=UPI00254D9381|nr:uncharacterized protein LOC130662355 isoform X2 [Hydractinia symbiolongicarpus]